MDVEGGRGAGIFGRTVYRQASGMRSGWKTWHVTHEVRAPLLWWHSPHVAMPGIDRLYDAYSMTAIPAIGKVVTGDGQPYRYLVESIRTFPDQKRFKAMIEAAGFARVSYRNLSAGIVAIHSGWRI